MPTSSEKFYVTTPIYYVNARPHIGHAYTTIVADTIARRKRSAGIDTWFLTGTDEHGQKIERSAAATGIPPQQFADQVSAQFEALWKRMGITNDDYIRTTDERHQRGAQKLFTTLFERGHIYLDSYTGQYSIGEEMFVDGPPGTIGPDGRPTETVTEENFYFRLSNFQRPLIDLIESGTLVIQNEARRNEVLSFLRGNVAAAAETALSAAGIPYVPGALKDLSVSRSSFNWGIPVPSPAADLTKQKHVIYVWLDALANYMTALGYGSDDETNFEKFWPADLHLVGKEIIRFHCVYWPAFLLAAGLPLPKAIVAHGWLLFEESKMSKSRGNIVRTETILEGFGALKPDTPKTEQDLFGADVLRYFLLREIPFGQDGSFSFDALVQRYNSDLANGYGNLVSRTLAMIQQYFGGVISPALSSSYRNQISAQQNAATLSFAAFSTEKLKILQEFFEIQDFHNYLASIQNIIHWADEMLSMYKPWKVRDSETSTNIVRNEALYFATEAIRIVTILLYPILPHATAQVWQQLGLGNIEEADRKGELSNLKWGGLEPGTQLGNLTPIFPRADKDTITRMTQMEQDKPTTPQPDPTQTETTQPLTPIADATIPTNPPVTEAPAKEYISIDDFAKVDLRVAQIKVAERIPKADKLLRLEVDLGDEQRQILSGIAEWYTPEDLIGKRIVVITNLAPRKMRGLESHGMLLAASHGEDGKPVLATFSEEIALGARLK